MWSATGVVLTAITAFVAVAPCPTRDVPIVVVVFSAIALIGACLLRACPPSARLPSVHRVYTGGTIHQHRPESFHPGG
jgi:hypothetical protein